MSASIVSSEDIPILRSAIDEIRTALVGDMSTRGLLHDVDGITTSIKDIRADLTDLRSRVCTIEATPHPVRVSVVVELVRVLASPAGVGVAFLIVVALAIVVNGVLGQTTDVRDIPRPTVSEPKSEPEATSRLTPEEIQTIKDFAAGIGTLVGPDAD